MTFNKDSVTMTETTRVFIDRCKQCKWEELNTMNSDEQLRLVGNEVLKGVTIRGSETSSGHPGIHKPDTVTLPPL